jgi:hypothetical protein
MTKDKLRPGYFEAYCRICGDYLGIMHQGTYQEVNGLCEKEECLEHVTPWNGSAVYEMGYAYACGYRD